MDVKHGNEMTDLRLTRHDDTSTSWCRAALTHLDEDADDGDCGPLQLVVGEMSVKYDALLLYRGAQ